MTFQPPVKKKTIMLVACLILNSFNATSQVENLLTWTEWNSITLNGKTFDQINGTNGDRSQFITLLGLSSSATLTGDHKNEPEPWVKYTNSNSTFVFSDNLGNGVFNLSGIKANTPIFQWVILGENAKVGDNVSVLGDFNYVPKTGDEQKIIYSATDSEGPVLYVRFDKNTNLITQIHYFILP